MRDSARIRIKDALTEMRFVWLGFDGDDCFNDFHIEVTGESGTQQFCFGACAVHGLKKLSKFFRDGTQGEVNLGFRHPDIRDCDIFRFDGEYRIVVRFEGGGLSKEYCVRKPSIQLEDEFWAEY